MLTIVAILAPPKSPLAPAIGSLAFSLGSPSWNWTVPLITVTYVTPALAAAVDDVLSHPNIAELLHYATQDPMVALHSAKRIAGVVGCRMDATPAWLHLQQTIGEALVLACAELLFCRSPHELVPLPVFLLEQECANGSDQRKPLLLEIDANMPRLELTLDEIEVIRKDTTHITAAA